MVLIVSYNGSPELLEVTAPLNELLPALLPPFAWCCVWWSGTKLGKE